jgi:integrase
MALKRVKMACGTIYQMAEKGNYYFRYQINGKRKSINLNTRNLEKAKEEAEKNIKLLTAPTAEVVAAHVQHAKGWTFNRERLEFEHIWETYAKHPERARPASQKVWNMYEAHLRDFLDWLIVAHPEVRYMDEIRDEDRLHRKLDHNIAGEYADYLKKQPIAVDTHNKRISRIGHIFKTLSKYLDAPTPWNNPKLKRSAKEEKHITAHRRPLPKDKEGEIFELLKPESNFRMLNKAEIEVLCHILKYTGQRQKDCVLLSWNKIDMERHRLSVTQEKTGKTVSIPIADELFTMLEKAESWRVNERVLPKTADRYSRKAADGTEIGVNLINKQILNLIEHVGLSPSVPVEGRRKKLTVYGVHSFRHAFASHCAETGIPRAVCASILGADADIIDSYYVHIGEEAQEKAIQSLSDRNRQTPEERIQAALELIANVPEKSELLCALEGILSGILNKKT